MPYRCAVYGCSNTPDTLKGIALHKIPFSEDDTRPEARKRRRKWINFVTTKRAKWTPTVNSRICSAHFKPEDYCRRFSTINSNDSSTSVSFVPRLVSDEIGIVPVPTLQASSLQEPSPAASMREHRMVRAL